MKLEGFPDYVKDYHQEVKQRYDSPQIGNRVAWEAVKFRLYSEDGQVVAQEENFRENRLYSFELDNPDQNLVHQAEDGSTWFEAVLSSTSPDVKGQYFTEEDLEQIAEKINSEGLAAPDLSHEELYNVVVSQGYDPEAVREQLAESRGFLDNVKAAVEDGKLWLRAKMDEVSENVQRVIDSFQGVSLEALSDKQPDGRMANPDPISFIFTNEPKNPDARVAR